MEEKKEKLLKLEMEYYKSYVFTSMSFVVLFTITLVTTNDYITRFYLSLNSLIFTLLFILTFLEYNRRYDRLRKNYRN